MAAAKDEEGYGSKYLTPYEEILETHRLAPGGAADAGSRLSADVAQTAAANALNPLLAPRDSGLGTVAAGQPVITPVTAVQPNPMIRPPVDFNMMPVEKQVAWQELAAKQQADQAAREKMALDIAEQRVKNDQRQEQVKQGTAMIAELSTLTPHDLEKYPLQKAELFKKYPAAAGSLEVDRAIGSLDARYNKHLDIDSDFRKSQTAVREKVLQKRIDDGFEMVKPLGPEKQRIYAAKVAENPEKAIQYATDIAAPAMRENAITNLKAAGFSDEEIAKYGTGPEFKYQAAGEAAKSRAALTTEKNKARQDWLALDKARIESGFKPDKPNAYAATRGKWNPELEEAHKQSFAYWDSLTPKIRDPRAGVAGMSTEYMPYQREQQAAVARTLPVTTPVAMRPPVQPIVPVRPGAPPQRVPVTQQRVQPTPAPTAPVAAPKPTPAPPPLNPAYPEHWVGGKRYIQMPDGKLYLSKVQ